MAPAISAHGGMLCTRYTCMSILCTRCMHHGGIVGARMLRLFSTVSWAVRLLVTSYTEKAEQGQRQPGTITTANPAEGICKQQRRPSKTKPSAIKINPGKRHNNPTHSSGPSRINEVNTRMAHTYRDAPACTRPSGGGRTVPALTNGKEPPRA